MKLTNLHFEVSTFCNADCPLCPHDNSGQTHPLINLSLDHVEEILKNPIMHDIKFVQLCGSHGDPIMHKNFIDLVLLIKKIKPAVEIEISTNGSIRLSSFWRELAKILTGEDHVIFGIDGLEDTHHIYRKNTDFNKIIENAVSFISNKGTAWWQFIPFEHNQHQIIDAYKLSQQYKFKHFFVKYERACYTNELKAPTIDPAKHKELISSRPNYDSLHNTFVSDKQFSSNCIHLNQKSIYIKADGTTTPCCFMGTFPSASVQYSSLSQQEIDNNIQKLVSSWQKFDTAFWECKKNCYSSQNH